MNRTRKYLTLELLKNDPERLKKIKLLNIVKFGINDTVYSKLNKPIDPFVYILIDTKGEKKYNSYIDIKKSVNNFYDFLEYIKDKPDYVTDYPFSNKFEHLHVVVLRIDSKVFNKFINGKYSELYSLDFINKHVVKDIKTKNEIKENDVYSVLTKSEKGKEKFIETLINEFGVDNKTINYFLNQDLNEYDIPPYSFEEYIR
jgi:hypothetical protein